MIIHIFVQVQTLSAVARTHKFATKKVDLPAKEGERVTIALAALLVGVFSFIDVIYVSLVYNGVSFLLNGDMT